VERLSEARELASRQSMLLATLRDLEDDRATEKLEDADYESMRARLTAETAEVMRRLDEIEAQHGEEDEAAERASQPIRHPGSRPPGLTQ